MARKRCSCSLNFAPPAKSRLGEGAVTRTQIGRAQSGGPSSGLGSGSGFPYPECFVSEGAESVAGCEMALDEDRGVN